MCKKQEKNCKYLHQCKIYSTFADFFTRAHNAAHAIQNTMKHITNKNKENKNAFTLLSGWSYAPRYSCRS